MKKSRFSESQIVSILKEGEAGVALEELSRQHGFSKATYYKWKAQYGGGGVGELGASKRGATMVAVGSGVEESADADGEIPAGRGDAALVTLGVGAAVSAVTVAGASVGEGGTAVSVAGGGVAVAAVTLASGAAGVSDAASCAWAVETPRIPTLDKARPAITTSERRREMFLREGSVSAVSFLLLRDGRQMVGGSVSKTN